MIIHMKYIFMKFTDKTYKIKKIQFMKFQYEI